MAPELFFGLTISDSYRFNLLWSEQFGELFRHGHLYPRWMPHAWGGLGSPAFYFYPPLFFWVAGVVDLVTGGALAPERFAPLASLILLATSGMTMRAWLRDQAGEGTALAGAIAYMLAPYHLYDIYARGAVAEASAYAWVPLVMLGLRWTAARRPHAVPLLALGYAALLLSHLPSALLVTLMLIGPYAAFLLFGCDRRGAFLLNALCGGLLGIAVAAAYLLPALGLLPYVSPGWLTSSFYQPQNWFFWHIDAGMFSARMILIIPVSVAACCLAASAAIADPRREPIFWAALAAAILLLIAGVVPQFWQLPGLKLVQFPWRALLPVEFIVATVLAAAAFRAWKPLMLAGIVALVVAYVALERSIVHVVGVTVSTQQEAAATLRADYADATEYLPAGSRIIAGNGPDPARVELPRLHHPAAANLDARIAAQSFGDGAMRLFITSPSATEVVLPRLFFPHWRVRDSSGREVPVHPTIRDRTVAFVAPAGQSRFELVEGTAPYERTGKVVSLLALLIVAAMFIGTRKQVSARTTR